MNSNLNYFEKLIQIFSMIINKLGLAEKSDKIVHNIKDKNLTHKV